MKLEEQVNNINSRDDFVAFVKGLRKDLEDHPSAWSNAELANFLEALASWTNDMDGYYINQGKAVPEKVSWGVFANILMGAKLYE